MCVCVCVCVCVCLGMQTLDPCEITRGEARGGRMMLIGTPSLSSSCVSCPRRACRSKRDGFVTKLSSLLPISTQVHTAIHMSKETKKCIQAKEPYVNSVANGKAEVTE